MEIVDTLWAYVQPAWAWLMVGLAAYGPQADGQIDWVFLGVQMGVIAVVMALLMPGYGAILIFTVAAMIVHVIVDNVLPMVRAGASFAMPPVTDMLYWQYLAFIGLAYLVAVSVLYLIKAVVLPR